MDEVEEILQRLNTHGDIGAIRRDVGDLIAQQLQIARGNLGYWEKECFVNAISALAWNIRSNQPSEAWLRVCLFDLEKAFVPKEKRSEHYGRHDPQLDAVTFEQLSEALEQVLAGR